MSVIPAVEEFLDDLRGGKMSESPVVHVEQGSLRGALVCASNKKHYSFLGIPFAKPPIGSLRFRAPQPPESWEGVRDATAEGNCPAQYDPFFFKKYLGDEDCLYLNVFTPSIEEESLPVMVYVHGGAFRFGTGSPSIYGGDYIVEKGVVLVTLNYRCGPLGFLCLNNPKVPGNAGLKDIVQALRWVKQNIKCFGGNPNNITVFGQSAGATSTALLTGSPLTKNLINRVILQSGAPFHSWNLQTHPLDNAKALAQELGCESDNFDEILEFLTTTPVKDIVEAYDRICPLELLFENRIQQFSPVIEKEFPLVESFITEPFMDLLTSGRVADIPIMIGSTTLEVVSDKNVDDLQIYIPKDLNIEENSPESAEIAKDLEKIYFKDSIAAASCLERSELLSDCIFNCAIYRYIKLLKNVTNKPIYFYKFDYVGELNISKKTQKEGAKDYAEHSDELFYLFKSEMSDGVTPTPQDIKMRERLVRLWTNFAKCGNPTPDENQYLTVTWLPLKRDDSHCLFLGKELSMGKLPDEEKMEYWDSLYNKYYKIWEHPNTNANVVTISGPEPVNEVPQIIEDTVETIVVDEDIVAEDDVVTNDTAMVDDNVNENVVVNEITIQTREDVTSTEDVAIETHESFTETTIVIKAQNENDTIVENNVQNLVDVTDCSTLKSQFVKNDIQITENNIHNQQTEQKVLDLTDEIGNINVQEKIKQYKATSNGSNGEEMKFNGSADKKPRPSREIKMVQSNNVNPKDVIRACDPPEDDLPKNIGVNKFVNFFESFGGKK